MKKSFYVYVLLIASLFLSSCATATPTPTPQPTSNTGEIAAAVAGTVQANFAQLTANAPTNTVVPTPTETPTPTMTLPPTPTVTFTPLPTATSTVTPVPTEAPVAIPCNQAAFIEDVTIPDGTQIAPGAGFTKTWQLENTGSCIWTTDYMVVFDSGNQMGGVSSFNMPSTVDPGQSIDISVSLTAPVDTGTFEGFWKLEDPSGNAFGVGASSADFEVQIVVGGTPVPFEVRHLDLDVSKSPAGVDCPPGNQFTITGKIRTNGVGDVVYNWEFSDGTTSAANTVSIGDSFVTTVKTTFTADATGRFWVVLQVSSPQIENSDKIFFSLTCHEPKATKTPKP